MSLFRHFSQRLKHHGWFEVIVDLIVVAGILLAFQLESWAEGRKERRLELVYSHSVPQPSPSYRDWCSTTRSTCG